MKLQGERRLAATPERTWAALNDPETLKACIPGCESLERTAEDEFLATMALRIGPVNARFKGRVKLLNIVPITSYTIAFDGQGGVAGFGKGSADVTLAPEGDGTRLAYVADAQVGGRLAQVGSRLVEGAAAKIADDFFAAFQARLASEGTGEADEASAPAAPAQSSADAASASAGRGDRAGPGRRIAWILLAVVVIALLAYWMR